MIRSIRSLSLPSSLPLLAALAVAPLPLRSQDAGTQYSLATSVMVRVPTLIADRFEPTLQEAVGSRAVFEAFVDAMGADAGLSQAEFGGAGITPVVPGRQAIVHIFWNVRAKSEPKVPDAVVAAVAKVVSDKLESLLVRPALEDFTRKHAQAEANANATETELDKLRERLAGLGLDDLASTQQALADLQRKALELELDLRTEEAVQPRLQEQLARTEAELRDNNQRDVVLGHQLEDAGARIDELKASGSNRPADFEQQLRAAQQQFVDLRTKESELTAANAHLRGLRIEMQNQLTASMLALQRHTSRKSVLDELLARQRKAVAEAAGRAREREQLQREADRLRAEAAGAQARARELRAQRDALEPVQVEPWK